MTNKDKYVSRIINSSTHNGLLKTGPRPAPTLHVGRERFRVPGPRCPSPCLSLLPVWEGHHGGDPLWLWFSGLRMMSLSERRGCHPGKMQPPGRVVSSLVCVLSAYPTVLVSQGARGRGQLGAWELPALRTGYHFNISGRTGWVVEAAAPPSLMLHLVSSAAARPQPWHPKPQLPAVSQAGACGAGPRSLGGKGEAEEVGKLFPSGLASRPFPTGMGGHP